MESDGSVPIAGKYWTMTNLQVVVCLDRVGRDDAAEVTKACIRILIWADMGCTVQPGLVLSGRILFAHCFSPGQSIAMVCSDTLPVLTVFLRFCPTCYPFACLIELTAV